MTFEALVSDIEAIDLNQSSDTIHKVMYSKGDTDGFIGPVYTDKRGYKVGIQFYGCGPVGDHSGPWFRIYFLRPNRSAFAARGNTCSIRVAMRVLLQRANRNTWKKR